MGVCVDCCYLDAASIKPLHPVAREALRATPARGRTDPLAPGRRAPFDVAALAELVRVRVGSVPS